MAGACWLCRVDLGSLDVLRIDTPPFPTFSRMTFASVTSEEAGMWGWTTLYSPENAIGIALSLHLPSSSSIKSTQHGRSSQRVSDIRASQNECGVPKQMEDSPP
jgi:hypothetical protein